MTPPPSAKPLALTGGRRGTITNGISRLRGREPGLSQTVRETAGRRPLSLSVVVSFCSPASRPLPTIRQHRLLPAPVQASSGFRRFQFVKRRDRSSGGAAGHSDSNGCKDGAHRDDGLRKLTQRTMTHPIHPEPECPTTRPGAPEEDLEVVWRLRLPEQPDWHWQKQELGGHRSWGGGGVLWPVQAGVDSDTRRRRWRCSRIDDRTPQ
jgi:hypothetical protein